MKNPMRLEGPMVMSVDGQVVWKLEDGETYEAVAGQVVGRGRLTVECRAPRKEEETTIDSYEQMRQELKAGTERATNQVAQVLAENAEMRETIKGLKEQNAHMSAELADAIAVVVQPKLDVAPAAGVPTVPTVGAGEVAGAVDKLAAPATSTGKVSSR